MSTIIKKTKKTKQRKKTKEKRNNIAAALRKFLERKTAQDRNRSFIQYTLLLMTQGTITNFS
jgi:hypothetical protein